MVQPTLNGKQGYEQFDVEGLNFFRRLLAAIQNKEFVVYFQPKVNIKDMTIAGAEALVRWECNGQVLPPVKFIPFCERTGLVIDVDFYVLEETCKQMREWMDAGIPLVRISVNFSKYHFNETGVAERIVKVIKQYNIPTEYIEVEFTETAYLDKEELLEYTVDKLRSYGIKSSIDDFGSGYSSLNLLQNMDFEVVKLDKSLLGKGVENEKAKKVISSIIHMAKELEMEVLAEGVETTEELKLLQKLNCDIVQGFLFDKPLPVDEFERRLRTRVYSMSSSKKANEGKKMELQDLDENQLKKIKERVKDEAVPPKKVNRYMISEEDFSVEKKHHGALIVGVILILLSLTILGGTVLYFGKGFNDRQKASDENVKTYTEEEVAAIVEGNVFAAKEETQKQTEESFKDNLYVAAKIPGGMANFLRSLFPDDLIFMNGSQFVFVPIDRSLKQSTIEAANFAIDPETGFMYYTNANGEKLSHIGIDVSKFQGDVDWKKVKDAGVEFAFVRVGFRGYGSEGKLMPDANYEANLKGATDAGIPLGVYFYTQALTPEEATEEAEFALKLIDGYTIDGPIVIDVETSGADERIKNLTADQRTDNIIAFCDTIKNAGYKPMIYSNVKYFTMYMDLSRLEDYAKWYANYNPLEINEEESIWAYNNPLMFPYKFDIWQYSMSGTLDGVTGEVDFDVLFDKWW